MSGQNKGLSDALSKQILSQIPTPILTVDKEYTITYFNEAGCNLMKTDLSSVVGKKCYDIFKSTSCKTEGCHMKKAIENGEASIFENEFVLHGEKKFIECNVAPLLDDTGEIIGGLESIQDITRRVLDDKKLREQSRAIQEMSTPTIKLWEGVLVLPVIGVIDSMRAQYMMESILNKILETSSKAIILDIHGVAAVDTAVANHLIKITKATKLMGCECLLSGISPSVAQTIIQLGINMATIRTTSTLSDALKEAFTIMDMNVVNLSE